MDMKASRSLSIRADMVSTSIHYAAIDQGSGRCRLTAQAFIALNIQIGWIVVLQLPNRESYMMTAWPDHMNELSSTDITSDTSLRMFYDATVRLPLSREDVRFDEFNVATAKV